MFWKKSITISGLLLACTAFAHEGMEIITVQPKGKTARVSGIYPYDSFWSYHNAASRYEGLAYFWDKRTDYISPSEVFGTNWVLTDSSTFTFLFPRGTDLRLKKIGFYDGSKTDYGADSLQQGIHLWAYPSNGSARQLIWRYGAGGAIGWKEKVLADSLAINRLEMVVHRPAGKAILPTEILLKGSWTPIISPSARNPKSSIGDHLGENVYPYNFQHPDKTTAGVWPAKAKVMDEVLQEFRFYCDFRWLEPLDPMKVAGGKSITPQYSLNGGWAFDTILTWAKKAGKRVLFTVKDIPDDIKSSYPKASSDRTPLPFHETSYLADRKNPKAYMRFARLMTQLAMRWGPNKNIDTGLCRIAPRTTTPWNPPLGMNTTRVGLDLVQQFEIGNELNRNWAGLQSYLAPDEYAALLSACADGHMGAMGDSIGIWRFAPTLKIAMMGMVGANPGYLLGIYDWCARNRGYKADGSINLPFDIVKFHVYVNDQGAEQSNTRTRGAAPETVDLQTLYSRMTRMAQGYMWGGQKDLPVEVGETGYDVNQSKQKAISIPAVGKGQQHTQADWLMRTLLINMQLGIAHTQVYQYADGSSAQYNADGTLDTIRPIYPYNGSGIVTRTNDPRKRKTAWIFQQVKRDFGEWECDRTIQWPAMGRSSTASPVFNGDSAFVVQLRRHGPLNDSLGGAAWLPTETGQTGVYRLKANGKKVLLVFDPSYDTSVTRNYWVKANRDTFTLAISEKPIFWKYQLPQQHAGNTLEIQYSTGSGTVGYATLPYNKEAVVMLTGDDDKIKAVKPMLAVFDTLQQTDGLGGQAKAAATLAVNFRKGYDNTEIGLANDGIYLPYSQWWPLIRNGWEIANHGFYHAPDAKNNYRSFSGNNDSVNMLYNIRNNNDSVYAKTGYRMSGLVASSNYPFTGSAGHTLGMLYVTGQSSVVFAPRSYVPRVSGIKTPGYIEKLSNYANVYRQFTDAWGTSLAKLKSMIDTLLPATPDIHRFVCIGTHGIDDIDAFTQFIQYIRQVGGDRILIAPLRQVLEHRQMAGFLAKSEKIKNHVLEVTLHPEKIPEQIQFRSITLLATNPGNIVSVKWEGKDLPFSKTTGQINIDFGKPDWWQKK